jgi:hypothetical protein
MRVEVVLRSLEIGGLSKHLIKEFATGHFNDLVAEAGGSDEEWIDHWLSVLDATGGMIGSEYSKVIAGDGQQAERGELVWIDAISTGNDFGNGIAIEKRRNDGSPASKWAGVNWRAQRRCVQEAEHETGVVDADPGALGKRIDGKDRGSITKLAADGRESVGAGAFFITIADDAKTRRVPDAVACVAWKEKCRYCAHSCSVLSRWARVEGA